MGRNWSLSLIFLSIPREVRVPRPYLAFSKKTVQLRPLQCQTIQPPRKHYGQLTPLVQNRRETREVAFQTHYHSLCMTKSILEPLWIPIRGTETPASFILIILWVQGFHLRMPKKGIPILLTKVRKICLTRYNNFTNFYQSTKIGKFTFFCSN